MNGNLAAFSNAIRTTGMGSPDIIADGDLHRFRDERDRPGTRNGWYVVHLDGIPAGAFGSWKTGEHHTWCIRETLTPAERDAMRIRVEAARARDREKVLKRQAQAAARVRAELAISSPPNPGHPYLVRKGIRSHCVRAIGSMLFVPIQVAGEVTSAQTIAPDGTKRFYPGGRIKGGYYRIDDETTRPDPLLVCEGFATGATLHEETGATVYVAFNAGNLLDVARHVREANQRALVIIAADNDAWTPGNPGLTKAHAAARAIGAKVLVPDFTGMDTSGKPTDWNDWYRLLLAGRAAA